MPEDTATQTIEGITVENTETKATETTPKGTEQPQEIVEAEGRQPEPEKSSEPEARKPKPSDYYNARVEYKKRVEKLENTISDLVNRIESLKPQSPPSEIKKEPLKLEIDNDKFYANPKEELLRILSSALEQDRVSLREELKKDIMEKDLPSLLESNTKKTVLFKKQQDAMELVFPKSGPEDTRTLKQRVESDPALMKKFDAIWDEHGLGHVWEVDPEKAARTFIKIAGIVKTQSKNPNAVDKKLMGSTATGSPAGGGKKMPTLDEVRQQLSILDDQVAEDPELRYEDNWKNKRKELVSTMSKLIKEQGK